VRGDKREQETVEQIRQAILQPFRDKKWLALN
jgi:hypothetical protein